MSKAKYAVTPTIVRQARLLSLAGDPTRLRILCFMFDTQSACVSEIAEALDMSLASISHHLQLMRDNGFFTTTRDGTKVCYQLSDQSFLTYLQTFICSVKS